jgi:hypothetical protein
VSWGSFLRLVFTFCCVGVRLFKLNCNTNKAWLENSSQHTSPDSSQGSNLHLIACDYLKDAFTAAGSCRIACRGHLTWSCTFYVRPALLAQVLRYLYRPCAAGQALIRLLSICTTGAPSSVPGYLRSSSYLDTWGQSGNPPDCSLVYWPSQPDWRLEAQANNLRYMYTTYIYIYIRFSHYPSVPSSKLLRPP